MQCGPDLLSPPVKHRRPRIGGVAGHDDVAGGAEHKADCTSTSNSKARHRPWRIAEQARHGYSTAASERLGSAVSSAQCGEVGAADRWRPGRRSQPTQLLPDRLERRGTGGRHGVGRPAAAEQLSPLHTLQLRRGWRPSHVASLVHMPRIDDAICCALAADMPLLRARRGRSSRRARRKISQWRGGRSRRGGLAPIAWSSAVCPCGSGRNFPVVRDQ